MNDELNKLLSQSGTIENLSQELSKGLSENGTFLGMGIWGIFASIVFSLIGIAYIKHGKKHGPFSTVIYGITLLVFPYVIYDTTLIIAIGVIVSAMPLIFSFG